MKGASNSPAAGPRRVAVLQSSYVPWKGYFDIIGSVDEFILYDDAAFSKNSWRNRNVIKVDGGTTWLTIPVATAGRLGQPIHDVEIADKRWSAKHFRSLQTWYGDTPGFDELEAELRALYAESAEERRLSQVNERFLRAICGWLGVTTRITRSADYRLVGDRSERLAGLCEQAGATVYLSGPAAMSYLDERPFAARGIAVEWMSYQGYPEYRQRSVPPFVHQVSILDLLLNEGPARARELFRGEGARTSREESACSSRS